MIVDVTSVEVLKPYRLRLEFDDGTAGESDHFPPHFHVFYARDSAVFAIEPAGLLKGSLPPRALGLVAEWASLHTAELLDDWERARLGKPLQRIEPLE